MKNLNALICLFTTSSMLSIAAHGRCIEENWIFLHERVTQVSECKAGEALALGKMKVSYPNMSQNPYLVEYWRGSYVRTIESQREYLHLILDKCSPKDDILLSEHVNFNEKNDISFSVENPNLSDSVSATYELVPMTDKEARAALVVAEQACEQYK